MNKTWCLFIGRSYILATENIYCAVLRHNTNICRNFENNNSMHSDHTQLPCVIVKVHRIHFIRIVSKIKYVRKHSFLVY